MPRLHEIRLSLKNSQEAIDECIDELIAMNQGRFKKGVVISTFNGVWLLLWGDSVKLPRSKSKNIETKIDEIYAEFREEFNRLGGIKPMEFSFYPHDATKWNSHYTKHIINTQTAHSVPDDQEVQNSE